MSSQTPMQKGIGFITQATEADRAKEYDRAFELYQSGIQWLLHAMKCAYEVDARRTYFTNYSMHADDRNESSRRAIGQRVQGYMSRAEELKKVLSGAASPAAAPYPLCRIAVQSLQTTPVVRLNLRVVCSQRVVLQRQARGVMGTRGTLKRRNSRGHCRVRI